MEFVNHTISWPTFFWTCLIIAIIWLFTTKTNIGSNIIASETRWSKTQWVRVLLVIVISMFVLINPLFHLLAVAVVGGLYFLLVSDRNISNGFFGLKEKGTVSSNTIVSNNNPTLSLICRVKEVASQLDLKENLHRCLFSFPFIKDQPHPVVHLVDDRYEVELSISNINYMSSLIEYIRQSGFEVEIKK